MKTILPQYKTQRECLDAMWSYLLLKSFGQAIAFIALAFTVYFLIWSFWEPALYSCLVVIASLALVVPYSSAEAQLKRLEKLDWPR